MKRSPRLELRRPKRRLPLNPTLSKQDPEDPMNRTLSLIALGAGTVCALVGLVAATINRSEMPVGSPEATIDLATESGVQLVKGQWRYHDTKIVDVDFRGPGPDGQPTGAPVKTYDYTPHAGGADFDDSAWEAIGATTLEQRRGHGRLGFNWYRIALTIPDKVGSFDPTGSTTVFETSIDDYAEIWVDGEIIRALGQSGGSVISGWNAGNRLVVGRNFKPWPKIQIAV